MRKILFNSYAHFEKQEGYYSSYSDVEAWLSDIEKKNVKLIQYYERKKD